MPGVGRLADGARGRSLVARALSCDDASSRCAAPLSNSGNSGVHDRSCGSARLRPFAAGRRRAVQHGCGGFLGWNMATALPVASLALRAGGLLVPASAICAAVCRQRSGGVADSGLLGLFSASLNTAMRGSLAAPWWWGWWCRHLHCDDDVGKNLSFLGMASMAPLASIPS